MNLLCGALPSSGVLDICDRCHVETQVSFFPDVRHGVSGL